MCVHACMCACVHVRASVHVRVRVCVSTLAGNQGKGNSGGIMERALEHMWKVPFTSTRVQPFQAHNITSTPAVALKCTTTTKQKTLLARCPSMNLACQGKSWGKLDGFGREVLRPAYVRPVFVQPGVARSEEWLGRWQGRHPPVRGR